MEIVKSNVGKGFGWENPINLGVRDVKSDFGKGFGWGNPTN